MREDQVMDGEVVVPRRVSEKPDPAVSGSSNVRPEAGRS